MRLFAPNPCAYRAANAAGVVAGVISANALLGGVAANSALCGILPCEYSPLRGVVLGSNVWMPAAYCASKGAVSLFTKALALELAPQGIRVNAVCPGDVASPMLDFQANTYGQGDPKAYFERLLAGYPQGPGRARFISPDEVAGLIHYRAQPEAAPITGALLSIDFGYSAGK